MTDVLLVRAEALGNRLGELKFGLHVARGDYTEAVSEVARASVSAADADPAVTQENFRHAEVLLAVYRKKLEAACALVEKELR